MISPDQISGEQVYVFRRPRAVPPCGRIPQSRYCSSLPSWLDWQEIGHFRESYSYRSLSGVLMTLQERRARHDAQVAHRQNKTASFYLPFDRAAVSVPTFLRRCWKYIACAGCEPIKKFLVGVSAIVYVPILGPDTPKELGEMKFKTFELDDPALLDHLNKCNGNSIVGTSDSLHC